MVMHPLLLQLLCAQDIFTVCQTANACQSGFTSIRGSTSPDTSTGIIPDQVQNLTMTCNTQPRVYAAGEMSCQVIVSAMPTFLQIFIPFLNYVRLIIESNITVPFPSTLRFDNSSYPEYIVDANSWYLIIRILGLSVCAALL